MIAIYPLSGVKVASGFAGTRHDFFRRRGGLVRRQDHQQYGGQNGAARDESSQRQRFAADGPAKEQGHNGIDEGVSGNAGRGAVLEDIDVGGKAKSGAERKKV